MVDAILKSITDVYGVMKFLQLYPEVMLAGLATYFIALQRFEIEKKKATFIPVIISFIGQLAFAWPNSMQKAFMCFTMGCVQAGVSIGIYSFVKEYKIMDRAGKLVQRKIDSAEGGTNATNTPKP